ARLFVTVRGDPSVTFVDVADDTNPSGPTGVCGAKICLQCDAGSGTLRCGDNHRVGINQADNPRHLLLPVEPVGIAASDDGVALAVANQTTNQASLVTNEAGSTPRLLFTVSSLPTGPTEIASVPIAAYVAKKVAEKPGACPSSNAPHSGFDYEPG